MIDDSLIVKTDWCEITQVGLRVNREPTWEEYELEVYRWTAAHRLSAWAIADLYNYGERKWGETYAQALDETGLSYGYIANICSVASRIDHERRRPGLSFSHHATVAYMPEEQQDYWLNRAEEEHLNRNELRQKINSLPAGTNELEVIPRKSLKEIVAEYIQAVRVQDQLKQDETFKEMSERVKDLLL